MSRPSDRALANGPRLILVAALVASLGMAAYPPWLIPRSGGPRLTYDWIISGGQREQSDVPKGYKPEGASWTGHIDLARLGVQLVGVWAAAGIGLLIFRPAATRTREFMAEVNREEEASRQERRRVEREEDEKLLQSEEYKAVTAWLDKIFPRRPDPVANRNATGPQRGPKK